MARPQGLPISTAFHRTAKLLAHRNQKQRSHVLAGGPGCSSVFAAFKGMALLQIIAIVACGLHALRDKWCACASENGPYQLNDDGEVEEREHAWDVTSNVIFVDSPVGTGFSYSDDPRDRVLNETMLAADMLDFLEEFFRGAPPCRTLFSVIMHLVDAGADTASKPACPAFTSHPK